MRELLLEGTAADRNLWLVVPDAWPDCPRLAWLVMGRTPDHMHSVTVPLEGEAIRKVVDALSRLFATHDE